MKEFLSILSCLVGIIALERFLLVLISVLLNCSTKVKCTTCLSKAYDPSELLDRMEDAIYIIAANGRVLDLNRRARELVSPSEPTLQDLMESLMQEKSEEERNCMLECLKGQLTEKTVECRIEGTYYLVTISPDYGKKGKLLSTNVIVHNIDKERLLSITLSNRNDILAQSNELYTKQIHTVNVLEEEKERLALLETIQSSLMIEIQTVVEAVTELRDNMPETLTEREDRFNQLTQHIRTILDQVRKSVNRLQHRKVPKR